MNKEEFIEIAKLIEIHIQNDGDYEACIGMGYFTERFNNVWTKFNKLNTKESMNKVERGNIKEK